MSDATAVSIPPGLLEEWCSALSHGSEMPAEAYLATGIAAVSAIVGPRLFIRWGPTRKERCNVWVLNVGRSALARKTTGMSAARWAVNVARAQLGDQLRWYSAKRLSDAAMAHDLDVVSADTAKAQKEEELIADAEKRKPRVIEPIYRKIPVSWLVGANEVAPLWGDGLRDWQQATQAFLLDVFDGEIVSRTRQTSVPEQETFVCMLGNIPPAALVDRTTMATLTSGFAGRWVVIPSPGPRFPVALPSANGHDPLAALKLVLEELARMGRACEGIDAVSLWREDAKAERERWYGAWWDELARADAASHEAGARADLFNRAQAHALKLATIAAVCRCVADVERLDEVEVEADDVAWAQGVVDGSIAFLMDVVSAGGGGATSALGRIENRIVSALRRFGATSEESGLTLRQINQQAKGSDTHKEIVQALESLAAVGVVEIAAVPSGPRGGRPGRRVWLTEGS